MAHDPDHIDDDSPTVQTTLHCTLCAEDRIFSAAVSVILVFAPALKEPYPLIPDENYRVCTHVEKGKSCDAVFNLVDRAVDAHPATRYAGRWRRAIVVFKDGRGADISSKHPTEVVGLA